MRGSLQTRIDRLEARCAASKLPRSPLVMLVEREQEGELAPGERVVEDWFRDCGPIVWARERVTTETEDQGRRCTAGGYLLDVLENSHDHVRGASGPEFVRCAKGLCCKWSRMVC
jgi:hypothetical protein